VNVGTKLCVPVDHSKSQLMDDKLFMKGAWSRHVTHYKFLVPLKYLWNGLSYILYTVGRVKN